MQLSHLLGSAVLIAAVGFSVRGDADNNNRLVIDPTQPLGGSSTVQVSPPATAPAAPVASGHFVLVVEGDRNGLAVTFARQKAARWAGVQKGFNSNWRVLIRDGNGAELVDVPIDVRPFATDAQSVGRAPRVNGCYVVESKIGLLLNVPAYAVAQTYEFTRAGTDGVKVPLGTMSGNAVRELAGGGR
jgi:hypothetical protein